jgi:hypothetical protein
LIPPVGKSSDGSIVWELVSPYLYSPGTPDGQIDLEYVVGELDTPLMSVTEVDELYRMEASGCSSRLLEVGDTETVFHTALNEHETETAGTAKVPSACIEITRGLSEGRKQL